MTEEKRNIIRNELIEKQKHLLNDLFYPKAINWMWNYCIPLGKYTEKWNDRTLEYDLGFHISQEYEGLSGAIVYDDKDGSYLSGNLSDAYSNCYKECVRRIIETFGQEFYDKLSKN